MAYLNGVDVSSWQQGINLQTLPGDFAICKATEGTSYVSPDFTRQANQTLAAGKLLGVYHYINGAGSDAEAQHFYNNIKPYIGKAIIVLDWESGGNTAWGNTSYLDAFIARIKALTGITPMIYASASVFPWTLAQKYGCSTWVAQYANNNATGYQANPWNEGAYTCDMRQYSSSGRLNGWNGNLDINKFYGDRAKWQQLAGQKTTTTTTEEAEVVADQDIQKIVNAFLNTKIDGQTVAHHIYWAHKDTEWIRNNRTSEYIADRVWDRQFDRKDGLGKMTAKDFLTWTNYDTDSLRGWRKTVTEALSKIVSGITTIIEKLTK